VVLGGRVETRLEHRWSGRGRNVCRRQLKAGGLKPPSGKIGALGVIVSGCRGPTIGKSGSRIVRREYSITTNTQ
jgi:hypothetical protein